MKISEIKSKILASCAAAKSQGFTIVNKCSGDKGSKTCCPIASLNVDNCGSLKVLAEKELGTTMEQTFSFIEAFDNSDYGYGMFDEVPLLNEFHHMGKEVARELGFTND